MSEGAITIPMRLIRRIVSGIAAVVVVALILGVLWQQRDALGAVFFRDIPEVDRNGYQAVFLQSGQVYFGKLAKRSDDMYLMTDVYYLSEPREGFPRGQLVKRGSELHGPREPMIVPARQVLLIENLREDSDVVQAIKKHKAGEPLAPAAPPLTSAGPTATPRPTGSR